MENKVKVNKYIDEAINEADGGFHTKASFKRCIDSLNRGFDCLHQLSIVDSPLLWLHTFKPEKHEESFVKEDYILAVKLKELRDKFKAMGITPKVKVKKEIKFTDRQATHWGTCQVCGRHHKVDKKYNVIAEHGYSLMYGGQSGSCFGSKHKPLELSCSISESWVKQLQNIKANNHKNAFVENDRYGDERKYVKLWLKEDGYKTPVQRTRTLEWADNYINKQINQTKKAIEDWKEKPLMPIEIWE